MALESVPLQSPGEDGPFELSGLGYSIEEFTLLFI